MSQTTHDVKAPEPPVFTAEHPEFPFLMYNHETRQTKPAKDKDDKAKLAKDGFVDDPYPAANPNALTAPEVQELERLLSKLGKYLATLAPPTTKPAPATAK